MLYDYLDTRDKERMVDQVFRAAYGSVANLVIFAVQDILKLGNWARMNTPSTLGTNWKWRMKKGELNDSHIKSAAIWRVSLAERTADNQYGTWNVVNGHVE